MATTLEPVVEARRVLSDINNNLEAQKAAKSFQAVTFEELFEQQVLAIEGGGTDLRPSQKDKVARLDEDMKKLVARLKDTPENEFEQPSDMDVNTPADLVEDDEELG